MTPTIKVEHVSKVYSVQEKRSGFAGSLRDLISPVYKDKRAVNDISFLIEPGELVGFIGPNGAGKTTTLKMLSGLLYPTTGTVRVLGHDPWKREYDFLTQISLIMGQKNQLWWDLPAIESFNLARDIYGLRANEYKKTLDNLVDLLGIADVLNVQVRKLSLGQRMKAELVAALLHNPKVLFLDEPTIGLDVVVQAQLRSFMKAYNQSHEGSIILTSHYMEDVKELCKRVIIIDEGQIHYDGLLADVITKFSRHKLIEVMLAEEVSSTRLRALPGLEKTEQGMAVYRVERTKTAERAGELLKYLPVADINIKEIPIEEVIRQVFSARSTK